ncbi:MAG: hypothetical protein QME48_05850 [bacterium]|nr:hypothetical protein [bacterium]
MLSVFSLVRSDEGSETQVDVVRSDYIEISGVQSFGYISRSILSGSVSNYYPYSNRDYSLNLSIKGKFGESSEIDGIIRNDSRLESPDMVNIKAFGKRWEVELGNSDNIGYDYSYGGGESVVMKGKYAEEGWDAGCGLGIPLGTYGSDYFEGDNTQGPFRLSGYPIMPMSETVTLTDNSGSRELMNGRDYTIDYRLGTIRINDILKDDQRLSVEYYIQSLLSAKRADYSLSGNLKGKNIYGGISFGGTYSRRDTVSDTVFSNYYVIGGRVGGSLNESNLLEMSYLTNVIDNGDTLKFSGNGINAKALAQIWGFSAIGNAYKSFGDFRRIGETGKREITNLNFDCLFTITDWSSLNAGYTRNFSEGSDERSWDAGVDVNMRRAGSVEYSYISSFSSVNDTYNAEYRGNRAIYSNDIAGNAVYIKGDSGKRSEWKDTVENSYLSDKIEVGNAYKANDKFCLKGSVMGERRTFADSLAQNYAFDCGVSYNAGEVLNAILNGSYLFSANSRVLMLGGNVGWKIKNYIRMNTKVNSEINSGNSYLDSIEESRIKYNILNSVSSTPLKGFTVGANNNILLARGTESGFMYQKNYINGGYANLNASFGQISIESGNGKYLNYSEGAGNELLSDNARFYVNSAVIPKITGKYTLKINEKYAENKGLTMSYIPVSYTEEVDTVSNEVNQRDFELGIESARSFTVGRANIGYIYAVNVRIMPDSIPLNAVSHSGYIGFGRKLIEGLDLDGKFTIEKRQGTDPDVERDDEPVNIIIANPQIGLSYAIYGYGSGGVIYSTSYYSGTSNQNRQRVGINLNFRKNAFEFSTSGNYQITKFYKILEFEVQLRIIL